MRRALCCLCLIVTACSHANRAAPPPSTTPEASEPVITLPSADAQPIALRLIVAGDGGAPGPVHAAVFGAARALADQVKAPTVVVMPGDLTYPKGLPADCQAARARLEQDYLSVLPSVTFVAVPGNHDHGDVDEGANPAVAARDAFFDCQEQASSVELTGWDAQTCACAPHWRAPIGVADVGTIPVLQPSSTRPGLSIVAYDSQQALAHPARVAGEVAHALQALPEGEQALILAHHPLRTAGAHEYGKNPQDAGSTTYQAYVKAFSEVLDHNPKVLLLVFGHDHSMQFSPGTPPELISGAAAKTSPVTAPPPGGFAKGDTPGLATVDLLQNGETRVTILWSGDPWTTTLPAPALSVRETPAP